MFMTTTLAHYQLPLFGIASSALKTEIGADARSIFLRPITSISPSTELPRSAVVQPVEASVQDVPFRTWMETVKRYETVATNTDGASEPAAGGETADADGARPEPTATSPDSVESAPQGQTTEPSEPSQQAPQTDAMQSEPANEAPAPSSAPAGEGSSGSSQARSGNRGNLLGGVIRY